MPPVGPPESRLITLPEAARRLGIGVRQLEAAREAGQLPIYRVGAWPRVTMRDVSAWLDQRRERRR
jgi:excisionase family DNA binding protein